MLSDAWCNSLRCPVQGQELYSMIFVGPLELGIFYGMSKNYDNI